MYSDTLLSGQPAFRQKQLRHALFNEFVSNFSEMTTFPKELREELAKESFLSFQVLRHHEGEEVEKVLIELSDGKKVEAVLMKHKGRNTFCVSSQVGCACDCSFCSTGALGFTRNLSEREIVEQVLYFARVLKKRWQEQHPGEKWNRETVGPEFVIRNVVFMGMGEPLLNLENVRAAVHTMAAPEGLNLGRRRITVSTVGIVPGIEDMLSWPEIPNLALSLHAATNALREEIVPMTKPYPLPKLFAALDAFSQKSGKRIFYEWAVLRGVNDTTEQMDALGELLEKRSAHMNFIPYNPGPSRISYKRPSIDHVRKMQEHLEKHYGVPSTIRTSYGDKIAGACGQLAAGE